MRTTILIRLLPLAIMLVSAVAWGQLHDPTPAVEPTDDLLSPEPPVDTAQDDYWGWSMWVWLALVGLLIAGAVTFFARRPNLSRRTDAFLIHETIEDAQRIWRDIQASAVEPDVQAAANELKREIDELERRVAEHPELEAMPALIARARELRAGLQRLLDQHAARRAA